MYSSPWLTGSSLGDPVPTLGTASSCLGGHYKAVQDDYCPIQHTDFPGERLETACAVSGDCKRPCVNTQRLSGFSSGLNLPLLK